MKYGSKISICQEKVTETIPPVLEVLEGTTGSLGMNYQNFLGAVAGVEVLGKDLVLQGAHTQAHRGR